MMEREVARVLARWGQDVTVYTKQAPQGVALRAFVRPIGERGTVQTVPSPLGQVKQDKVLYLGPANVPLDEDSRVRAEDDLWRVDIAQPIRMGGTVSHWRAVLSRRAGEVVG